MNYRIGQGRLDELRQRIAALREEMRTVQRATEPERIQDYLLATLDGPTRLSELFGTREDLIVIHNMGRSCAYCTLWADGYNGVYPQLSRRAAFVLTSPDSPVEQAQFARRRGWRFPMASHQASRFAFDLGYADERGQYRPGISALRRQGGEIVRLSDCGSRPGDDFCSVWHLFDLFPNGAAGWRPTIAPLMQEE